MKRTMILLALLALVVAGCASGEGAATPSPTATPTPEPTPTEEPSAPVEPSLEEGAGDLDALLPDEIGGMTIQYQHTEGGDVLGAQGITPEAEAFFERVGADPSELSSAFGFAFDPEAGGGISIVAIRVAGANEDQLRDEFVATMTQEGETIGEEQTVGGKSVLSVGDAEGTGNAFLYVHDDVVYIVAGEPAALTEEALEALP